MQLREGLLVAGDFQLILKELVMIFIFLMSLLIPLIFAGVFIKLGALSVLVHLLSVALNFAMLLIVGFALALFSLAWKSKRNQIDRRIL